ncbi:MAG: MarR family transcriptional regulator [Deltaproteobacteria bacterium]|nr:MarR family transcriptional regulator [Nannocystaceae bacterium]
MARPTEPQVSEAERASLEEAKRASVSQLLFKCARLLNELAIARARARTGIDVRVAHTSLFPHIDLEGTRLTELARRLGVSKQAAGQLVDELVEMGVLERVADPEDARAKRIRFARRRGAIALMEGLAVLGELETEIDEKLGHRRVTALHGTLLALLGLLERGEL